MSNLCNSLNIKTLKISQLREYNTINSDDIFLVIESADSLYSRKTTFGNILNSLKYINASYVGSFTGSFSGSAFGKLTGSFNGTGYGNFNGGFTGSIISNNFKGTGSLYSNNLYTNNFKGTGSFYGIDNIINFKNSGKNVSFNGTASYAISSSYAYYATSLAPNFVAPGDDPLEIADENNFAYWDTTNTIKGTNYIFRSPEIVNKKTTAIINPYDSISNFGDGTLSISKPLYFNNNDQEKLLVGENIILKSKTGEATHAIGMQENTMYLRADSNFIIYHSGSFFSAKPENDITGNKNRLLNPGKNGYTVFSTCRRLVGIGQFDKSTNINALLHVNLSGSNGYRPNYNPNTNAFLITSGSKNTTTNLLRVSGSGQLDVKGDIIALSTFASSDERLKVDIEPINNSNQLINQLNPVQFKWVSNNQNDYGLIAQEVEQYYPELIKEDINGYKTVKYNSFIPILIKSVQDLKEEINQLKEKIKDL